MSQSKVDFKTTVNASGKRTWLNQTGVEFTDVGG